MGTKKQSRPKFPVAILPVFLAICLYINTVPNQYCLDDTVVVCNNSYVHAGLKGVPDILTTNFLNGFNHYNDGLYRPLPVMTYAFEYSLWGLKPGFSHFINILLYALAGYFIFLLLKKLFPGASVILPLSISLLFIAHPVHTEVVANIKGRDDLLALLFSILASYYLLRYVDTTRPLFLIFGLLGYSLSLLSKESAVMFMLIVPLMILCFRKPRLKTLLVTGSFMLVVTLLWLLWRSHIIHSMSQPVYKGIYSALNNSILSTNDTLSRIATGFYFQLLYFIKLILPVQLTHDYSYNQIPVIPAFSLKACLSLLVVLALMMYAIICFKKQKSISFGIFFYFITISIVANIFIYIGATFAERFLFTPSLGFSIITGVLLYKLVEKDLKDKSPGNLFSKNIIYTVVLLCILLLYSVKTISRNFDWENNFTLYTADISRSPNSARVHFDYGSGFYATANRETSRENRTELLLHALTELKTALRIYPDYPDALINAGNIYQSLNQTDSAITCYRRILRIDSTYKEANYNLGYTYYTASKFKESIYFLKKFLQTSTDNANAYYLIGSSYNNLENFHEAIVYLEKCVSLDPGNKDALVILGIAYEMVKDWGKALDIFNRILHSDPLHMEANFNMGLIYENLNQPDRSIEYFLKCTQIDPGFIHAYEQLIRCYQITGDKQKVEYYMRKLAEIKVN